MGKVVNGMTKILSKEIRVANQARNTTEIMTKMHKEVKMANPTPEMNRVTKLDKLDKVTKEIRAAKVTKTAKALSLDKAVKEIKGHNLDKETTTTTTTTTTT